MSDVQAAKAWGLREAANILRREARGYQQSARAGFPDTSIAIVLEQEAESIEAYAHAVEAHPPDWPGAHMKQPPMTERDRAMFRAGAEAQRQEHWRKAILAQERCDALRVFFEEDVPLVEPPADRT